MRGLTQLVFLSPKPLYLPPMPKQRPYVGAIILTNAMCIILHIWTSRPEANEMMRGYLHGGVLMDFIGYKGPTWKTHLVMMDLLVLALQCFMLAVHVERERLRELSNAVKPASAEPRGAQATQQDHDAEERGVLGDSVIENGDIELQTMRGSGGRSPAGAEPSEDDDERNPLFAEPQETEEVDHAMDAFYSGQAIVGDFHIIHTLRTQWRNYQGATPRLNRNAATTTTSSTEDALGAIQTSVGLAGRMQRLMESRRR
jgi:hypothetical protein